MLVTMETEILQFLPILSSVGSLIIQTLAMLIIIKAFKQKPDRNTITLFVIYFVVVSVLCVITVTTFFFTELLEFSPIILFASAVIITTIALQISFAHKPKYIVKEVPVKSEPIADSDLDDEIEEIEEIEEVCEDSSEDYYTIGKSFMESVSDSVTDEVNIVKLYDFINQTLVESTDADGGVIFIIDDFDDIIASKSYTGKFPPPYKLPEDLPHKPVRVETNFKYVQFNLGESIFGEVASSGKPILIEDGLIDERVFTNGPEDFLKPGSYISVPLVVDDRIIGVAGLARVPEREPFTDKDLETSVKLASFSGSAINNVITVLELLEKADLEREASIASRIQQTLHPKRLPNLNEVGFGAFFNPTKGVCGDYYDIILARRDKIGIVIADIAGKGIQSSVVMSMLRSILHLVTNTKKSASTILEWINKGITGKIDMDHYATLSFLSYSIDDKKLEYANAGHQPMLIWRNAKKEIETVVQKTDPIGIERKTVYSEIMLTVEKGDIIILYTDGLVEALNKEGKPYGLSSLTKIVSENCNLSAKDIANEVKIDLQNFVGKENLHDDQTLMVIQIKS